MAHTKVTSLFLPLGLIFLGLILLLSAIVMHKNQASPPDATLPPSAAVDVPSSEKPSYESVNSYTVSPSLPKFIAVPSANVPTSRVMALGVGKDNDIAIPDNIYDVGWYNKSAKPGQQGAMFIFGHVSNWDANGIFYNLRNVKPGDEVLITRGDDTQFTYKVVATKIYPYKEVDMPTVLSPVNPDTPGLNLMTCTGKIIEGTSEFDERLVVFTSLVTP